MAFGRRRPGGRDGRSRRSDESPAKTSERAGPGGVMGDLNVEYYAQRASAGLIVTEGTQVSPQGEVCGAVSGERRVALPSGSWLAV